MNLMNMNFENTKLSHCDLHSIKMQKNISLNKHDKCVEEDDDISQYGERRIYNKKNSMINLVFTRH